MNRKLFEVPDDVILAITRYLGLYDAFNLALTSRRMRDLSENETAYWANVLTNSHIPLPLPPYEDIWHLNATRLREIAVRLMSQEDNLSQEEPRLRKWMAHDNFQGAYGFQENFVTIPGCPLLIIGEKVDAPEQGDADPNLDSDTSDLESTFTGGDSSDDSREPTILSTRISCFNYLEGAMLCSIKWPFRLYTMSQPYHGHGRCTLALQMNLNHDYSSKPGMFILTVQYRWSDETKQWQVDMDLERIPSVETDPLAGLPLYDMSIDESVVAYLIAVQGEYLKVVVHEITTGKTIQMTTDISLEEQNSQSSDYQLHLMNKELYIIREDASFTNLWRIPHDLLPYPDNSPESHVNFLCVSDNLGHSYGVTQGTFGIHWVAIHRHPAGSTSPDQFQYRRWSLSPGSPPQCWLLGGHSPYDIRQPMACDGPQGANSSSSVLFITKTKKKPFKLRLARLDPINIGRPLVEKVLEIPPEFEASLGKIRHLHFDDGLATAILLSGNLGRLFVLRYG